MAKSTPRVVILRLSEETAAFGSMFIGEQAASEQAYEVEIVKEAANLDLLEPKRPDAIIIADDAVAQNENLELLAELAEYVMAGGTVILTLRSPMKCTINQLEATFKLFNRHWKVNVFRLNPAMKDFLGHAASHLEESHAIGAINLLSVADHEKFYLPYSEGSSSVTVIDSHENGCSAAFAQVGAGLFGYVGDDGFGDRTRDIIKAMIDRALAGVQSNSPLNTSSSRTTDDHSSRAVTQARGLSLFEQSLPSGYRLRRKLTLRPRSPSQPPTSEASSSIPPLPLQVYYDCVADISSEPAYESIYYTSPEHKNNDNNENGIPSLQRCDAGCHVCGNLSPANTCAACKSVQYCSATCQREDWPSHQQICKEKQAVTLMLATLMCQDDGIEGINALVEELKNERDPRIDEMMGDSGSEDFNMDW